MPLDTIDGLCGGECPARAIPRLPAAQLYCDDNPLADYCYPVRSEDVLFTDAEMAVIERQNNLPNYHTRLCTAPAGRRLQSSAAPGCAPPSAPPSAPPPPLCDTPSLVEHRYYTNESLVAQGTPPQAAADCPAWCAAQAEIACEARAGLLFGETLGCGFDPCEPPRRTACHPQAIRTLL